MIVKFNSRGAGAGSGPVDYLLGKERDREQAKTLRGDPERVKTLIDTCDFARTYTLVCSRLKRKISLTLINSS